MVTLTTLRTLSTDATSTTTPITHPTHLTHLTHLTCAGNPSAGRQDNGKCAMGNRQRDNFQWKMDNATTKRQRGAGGFSPLLPGVLDKEKTTMGKCKAPCVKTPDPDFETP